MTMFMAGCDKYEPWAALLVGAWGGMGYMAMHHLMIKMKLDDPLGKTFVSTVKCRIIGSEML